MNKIASILAVLLAVFLLGLASQNQEKQIEEKESRPQGQAGIRIDVQQIRVDVTVRNKDGNLIGGLQKQHFEVYEDKVRQEITYFEPVQAPMTAVLIIEYSRNLPWEMLYEAIMASYTFVDQMRKGDWVAVIAYDLRPEILVDFTQNKGEVYQSLRRLNYPGYSESNFYDTLFDTLDRVQELDQRTAVVCLTSGLDTFSKKNLNEMLDKTKKSNTVIYSVSLGGNLRARAESYMPSMTRLDFYQADAALKAFAKYTGGEAFFPRFNSQFNDIFNTIGALLRHQYSLGYVSTNTKKDGKYRKIKVELKVDVDGDGKVDKLKVRHREGYLTEKPGKS
jgi:VWFA-related protein